MAMIRRFSLGFAFVALLFVSGCGSVTGQQAANQDAWLRKMNEDFDRLRAEHMKQSSEAARGHLRHMNQNP
jgi:uncharacterized protein YceK